MFGDDFTIGARREAAQMLIVEKFVDPLELAVLVIEHI